MTKGEEGLVSLKGEKKSGREEGDSKKGNKRDRIAEGVRK